jgi:hypothetical protein
LLITATTPSKVQSDQDFPEALRMSEQEHWTKGPLYVKLATVLPAFVQDPFSATPKLKVLPLCAAINHSHEAVYRWLRSGKITPGGVTAIVAVANKPQNLSALKALDRVPPTREDFTDFIFA